MKKKLGQITDCLISYILLRTREKYKKEKHHDKPYSLMNTPPLAPQIDPILGCCIWLSPWQPYHTGCDSWAQYLTKPYLIWPMLKLILMLPQAVWGLPLKLMNFLNKNYSKTGKCMPFNLWNHHSTHKVVYCETKTFRIDFSGGNSWVTGQHCIS